MDVKHIIERNLGFCRAIQYQCPRQYQMEIRLSTLCDR